MGFFVFLLVVAVGWLIYLVFDLRSRMENLERKLKPSAPEEKVPLGEKPSATSTAAATGNPKPAEPVSGERIREAVVPPPLPKSPAPVGPGVNGPPPKDPVSAFFSKIFSGNFQWEQFLGVKLFAWIGGLVLFLGVAFFVKYSFDQGLLSPAVRVTL